MRAIANVLGANVSPYIRLEHEGENLTFSISVFKCESFQGNNAGVLDHINAYWEQLPYDNQKRIFEIYRSIDYGLSSIYSENDLIEHLTDRVAELIAEHNLIHIQYWVQNKSNIVIPDSVFSQNYQHSFDNNTTREKTYTKDDYIQLVSLSLLLRCMIPVWGEYISQNRKKLGTKFKEYSAFQLLKKSDLVSSAPMMKLRVYVEGMVGQDKFNPNNIHNFIASEDFCYFTVALICVRRLCIGNVNWRPEEPKIHLASLIYKCVIRQIQGTDSNSENDVRKKKQDSETDGSGYSEKISSLEKYRFKYNISPGEIAELEVSMRNIVDVTKKIAYDVHDGLLQRSLMTSQVLASHRKLSPQINIMRWVFKSIISPRGMMYLPDHIVTQALGACEAILWSKGYKYLAVLVTSYEASNEKALDMRISSADAKVQIPEDLIKRIDRVFPFSRNVKAKKSDNNQNEYVSINLTLKAISDLVDSLRMVSWKPSCHDDMLMEVFGSLNRHTPIRADIKIELVKLVLDITENKW